MDENVVRPQSRPPARATADSSRRQHPGGSPERRRANQYHSALPRLQEATPSDTNIRHPAADTGSLKHKPSLLPEPPGKTRKTLAERAGEPPAPRQGHSYSRSVNGIPTYQTYGGPRTTSNSMSSSTSSRITSASSRTASSNSSIAMKQPANGLYRPVSAMSLNKNPLQMSAHGHRPATSVGGALSESKNSNQTGTQSLSRCPPHSYEDHSALNVPKLRGKKTVGTYIKASDLSATGQETSSGATPRDLSIVTSMENLSLDSNRPVISSRAAATPSKLPTPVADTPCTKQKRSRKSFSPQKELATPGFLSKTSNTPARPAWDTDRRLEAMEKNFGTIKEQMEASSATKVQFDQTVELYKQKVAELESAGHQLKLEKSMTQGELEGLKVKLNSITVALEEGRRTHSLDIDDLKRKHRNEIDDLRSEHRREDESRRGQAQNEVEDLRRQQAALLSETERRLRGEAEEERSRRYQEVQDIQNQLSLQRQTVEQDTSARERQEQRFQQEIDQLHATIESERVLNAALREKLNQSATQLATLEASLDASKAKTHFLESDSQAQSQAFADLNARMQQAIESAAEANEKLRAEETLRRKLHNQIQELKGNIRVFCRVRPALGSDAEEAAKLAFPDAETESKELVVAGPEAKSAIGTDRTSKHSFAFDHVFGPSAQNPDVFEEISQLVQSALDGYNVCIFCYGQTGSGKTHTMSSSDGMIPLAVQQIYQTAANLEERGWKYTMEGSFVEVYNENLNDLLGKASDLDKKKLDIKHDMQKGKTTITDVTTMELDSPDTVDTLLERAASNRTVAATKANERSSRSHSVFILKLEGTNSVTGERSEGTLNLVDLAGSERLAQSQATGERLKETQNINKSLSALGDVIAALGQGKEGAHIPYRNSKLTYLLQQSLGGNSKTLMFVMVSPLLPHLSETITSLKFATKVHNTHIGTAKKQASSSKS